ncbi:glycoside hydrolase family 3 N-terminal domain-containing protein [Burkholderia oklahomensis]|nr:glycoside hydrolase family 3 protein [Burkholderia oklahomensis]MDN7673563.1 glycoside hydrolase family 3 N-terminal domain-containing protein [Burkholderia oklahomensis]
MEWRKCRGHSRGKDLVKMRKKSLVHFPVALALTAALGACSGDDDATIESRADAIVERMTTRQKVGQKIMMAFRYWCPDGQSTCTAGMTEFPDAARDALRENGIGGVILFSNNLTGIEQTRRLIDGIRAAPAADSPVGLLIGIDEEGGNVFRLPRVEATAFAGNMALGAAYEATKNDQLSYDMGRVLAAEIAAVGFNVNFAPDVDVNSNPRNPVINVRSFGDDPATISLLGRRMAQGMKSERVIGTFKHFPGHGDTDTDSHYGLPVVNKSRADAYAIDLAPYRQAIEAGQAPDMIMTAHIQYPSLDDTRVTTRTGKPMIAPATMSRRIQHDILRGEFGYRGVTITDALDMKGIADFFEEDDAVVKVFQADVDIALMPVEFRTAADAGRLTALVDRVAAAVESGRIDRAEFDRSVRRIVLTKLRNGIVATDRGRPVEALASIGGPAHRAVERDIAQKSITLLRNENGTLPLQAQGRRIFILTPWGEQAEAMRRRFAELGHPLVTGAKLSAITWPEQQQAIDAADIVIVGTLSTGVTPVEHNGDPNARVAPPAAALMRQTAPANGQEEGSVIFDHVENADSNAGAGTDVRTRRSVLAVAVPSEAQQMRDAMDYAKARRKTVIHVTMRAPYDVISYDDVADATLATYAYYGYEGGLRGPSLPAVVDAMLGVERPVGKLPVAIHALNADGSTGPLRYPRGFGLQY